MEENKEREREREIISKQMEQQRGDGGYHIHREYQIERETERI